MERLSRLMGKLTDGVLFVRLCKNMGYYMSACANRRGTYYYLSACAKMTGYYFAGVLFVRILLTQMKFPHALISFSLSAIKILFDLINSLTS